MFDIFKVFSKQKKNTCIHIPIHICISLRREQIPSHIQECSHHWINWTEPTKANQTQNNREIQGKFSRTVIFWTHFYSKSKRMNFIQWKFSFFAAFENYWWIMTRNGRVSKSRRTEFNGIQKWIRIKRKKKTFLKEWKNRNLSFLNYPFAFPYTTKHCFFFLFRSTYFDNEEKKKSNWRTYRE